MKLSWKDATKIFAVLFGLYLGIRYWPSAVGWIKALLSAALPLILGCVIAYLVNILMRVYEKHYFPNSPKSYIQSSRRPVCMLGAFATLIAIVVLIFGLIVPQLVSCVRLIIEKVPGFIANALAMADSWGIVPDDIMARLQSIDWNSRIGQIVQFLTSGIGDVMSVVVTTVSSVFSGLVTGLLSVIFSIYLLSSKETLCQQAHRLMTHYLHEKLCRKIEYVLDILNDCFHRYIVGQCLEAVIIGVLCALGMSLLQLPYASMIGALVGFTALIPVAGAYIGAIVGAFMILTVSPVKALIFLIFLVVLQQLEGNLIYPKVVGSSMGLPGIWVLAAVTVGGGIMGIGGMLLGVPLAAAAYRLISEDIKRNTMLDPVMQIIPDFEPEKEECNEPRE